MQPAAAKRGATGSSGSEIKRGNHGKVGERREKVSGVRVGAEACLLLLECVAVCILQCFQQSGSDEENLASSCQLVAPALGGHGGSYWRAACAGAGEMNGLRVGGAGGGNPRDWQQRAISPLCLARLCRAKSPNLISARQQHEADSDTARQQQ